MRESPQKKKMRMRKKESQSQKKNLLLNDSFSPTNTLSNTTNQLQLINYNQAIKKLSITKHYPDQKKKQNGMYKQTPLFFFPK